MQSCLKLIKAVENVRNVEIRVAVFAKSTRILALSRIKTGTSIPLDGGRGGEIVGHVSRVNLGKYNTLVARTLHLEYE